MERKRYATKDNENNNKNKNFRNMDNDSNFETCVIPDKSIKS